MKRRPTLGYPSKTAAVNSLRDQGFRPCEIARKLFCASRSISALSQTQMRRTVHVSRDVLEALKPFADRRGICATQLAKRLLTKTVDDDLVDAILDDR